MSCLCLKDAHIYICRKQCSRSKRAKCKKWFSSKYQLLKRRG